MLTTYQRTAIAPVISDRVSDGKMRTYTFTIHDLPIEEKPREKLGTHGPDALSMADLLAVILNVGTKKEEILSMTNRIIKEYGEKSIQSARNPQRLADDLDIPKGHALQIVAAVELGRRLFNRNPNGAQVIRTAEDVYNYARAMAELPKEHLRGIYLNSHYKVVHDEVVSIGTIDTNLIHPREVFRPALEYAVAAVILVHNHPSGSLEPSEADIAVTKQLIEAGKLIGIDLVDHVIVSREGFASIFDSPAFL
jgi:DNA repair protein RadC